MIRTLTVVLGLSVSASFGLEVDCTKITPRFCATLTEAQSDTQKIAAVIVLVHPEYPTVDSACIGVDPKHDTTGKCGNDSAYYASVRTKLMEYAEDLLNSYELWDARNPSQLFLPPSEPISAFHIIATKATLVNASREDYVFKIDRYEEPGPARIRTLGRGTAYREKTEADAFQINGRKLGGRVSNQIPRMTRPAH
jgi:hypothetical protein